MLKVQNSVVILSSVIIDNGWHHRLHNKTAKRKHSKNEDSNWNANTVFAIANRPLPRRRMSFCHVRDFDSNREIDRYRGTWKKEWMLSSFGYVGIPHVLHSAGRFRILFVMCHCWWHLAQQYRAMYSKICSICIVSNHRMLWRQQTITLSLSLSHSLSISLFN